MVSGPKALELASDMLWDMVWDAFKVNPQEYVTRFATYHYGQSVANAQNAWKILSTTALNCPSSHSQDGASESVINVRPRLDVDRASSWSTTTLYYDQKAILPAWIFMINSIDEFSDKTTFRFDLVVINRQCLANYAQVLQKEMTVVLRARNKALFVAKSKLFLG